MNIDKCRICFKNLSELNVTNKVRHIGKCNRISKRKHQSMSITNYFKTRSIKLGEEDHSNDATNVSTSPLSPQPTIIEPFVNSYEDNSNEVANIAATSLSPTPTEFECVIIDNSTNHSSLKCTGLLYEVDVFKNFPFAVLASQEFVIENQNFHHQMCIWKIITL